MFSCFLVGCEKLVDKDIVSRSDPMCVLFMKAQNSWLEVGRTEEIKGKGMKNLVHHCSVFHVRISLWQILGYACYTVCCFALLTTRYFCRF